MNKLRYQTRDMKKKQLLIGGGIAVILLLMFGVWNLWFSATKVAFINYQVISLGQISKANDNSFIKISELSTDDLDRLTGYDMIFINAMGLRITEEQREQIQKAADGGLPILTTAATNPANNIISLDSIQADTVLDFERTFSSCRCIAYYSSYPFAIIDR